MDRVTLRRASSTDRAFLAEMLHEAAYPPGTSRPSLALAVQEPRNQRFLEGWSCQPGDIGVVALDGDRPIGAAWCRCFPGPEVLSQ